MLSFYRHAGHKHNLPRAVCRGFYCKDLSTDAYAKEVFLHCTVTQQKCRKHRHISLGHKEILLESECRENREI